MKFNGSFLETYTQRADKERLMGLIDLALDCRDEQRIS